MCVFVYVCNRLSCPTCPCLIVSPALLRFYLPQLCESLEDLQNVNGQLRTEGQAIWSMMGGILGQVWLNFNRLILSLPCPSSFRLSLRPIPSLIRLYASSITAPVSLQPTPIQTASFQAFWSGWDGPVFYIFIANFWIPLQSYVTQGFLKNIFYFILVFCNYFPPS